MLLCMLVGSWSGIVVVRDGSGQVTVIVVSKGQLVLESNRVWLGFGGALEE